MTAAEKFSLAKALHDARLTHGPMVAHQFEMCVGAVMETVCAGREEFHMFRMLIDRENWIEQDNPFRD